MSGKRHQDGGEQAVPSKDGRADDISYPNDVEFAPGKRPAPVSMRRGRALLPVDGLAVAAADKVLRKRGFAQATLIRAWPTIVGETFARVSIPEKISYPPHRRSGGVLHLRVERGAALEIQHQEPRLIERINATFGYAAISRIAIRQGPLPRTARRRRVPLGRASAAEQERIADAVSGIASGSLRKALADLGSAIAARDAAKDREGSA